MNYRHKQNGQQYKCVTVVRFIFCMSKCLGHIRKSLIKPFIDDACSRHIVSAVYLYLFLG